MNRGVKVLTEVVFVVVILLIILIVVLVISAYSSVCSNCAGISYNSLTNRFNDKKVYTEGLYYTGFYKSFKTITTLQQTYKFINLGSRSSDGLSLPIGVVVMFKYILTFEDIKRVVFDFEDYDTVLRNEISMILYDVISSFDAFQVYKGRSNMVNKMKKDLSEKLMKYSINVTEVYFTDSDLPSQISDAIQESVNAEQDITLARAEQELTKIKAQTLVEQYTMLAEIERIKGQLESEVLLLQSMANANSTAIMRKIESETYNEFINQINVSTKGFGENEFMKYLWISSNKDTQSSGSILKIKKPKIL